MKFESAQNKLLPGALLCLLAALALWPVASGEFIDFDDFYYVTENPHVQSGLNVESVSWAFSTGRTGNWQPVTWLSHILDVQVYGMHPAGHHLTSLALHVADTLLVFLVLSQMTGALWRSALAAALFAVHPLHVESVAWIAERKDVLSTFFFLLALMAYASYADGKAEDRWPKAERNPKTENRKQAVYGYGFALIFFALGLMSKPMLVTLPFLLLLLDYWPLDRFQVSGFRFQVSTLGRLVSEKVPFFILSALFSFITYHTQHAAGAVVSAAELPPQERLANALVSYLGYLEKAFWPVNLAVFYPRPSHWPDWEVASAALVLIAITALAFWKAHRNPYLLVGWLWFVGTLVPVIGLVKVGEQAMADRYSYIPSIGLFIMLTWAAADFLRNSQRTRTLAAAAGLLVLAVLCVVTRRQVSYWQNSETLFRHALAVTENNAMAHNLLGRVLSREGNLAEAETNYLAALRLVPGDEDMQVDCAIVEAREGKLDEAAARLAQVLRQYPSDANAHYNLASILNLQGDTAAAVEHYRQALNLDPDYPDALNNLAWIRAASADPSLRSGAEAVRLAEKACQLTRYRQPVFIGTLAAAYAEAGRFDEAVSAAQKASALAAAKGDTAASGRNTELLEVYRAGRTYHESPQTNGVPRK